MSLGAAGLRVLLLCLMAGGLLGCESMFGKFVVRSPNHGKALHELYHTEPLTLPLTVIDHEFRLTVDEAEDISLAVWVIDPSNDRLVSVEQGADKLKLKFSGTLPRQTRAPQATVMLFHGYHDSMNQRRYLMWARILAAEGYRVVLVDQRGHGRSTGDWSTYGVKEAGDMVAVLDELDRRGLRVGPVGVAGVSFGAAVAMQLAERDERVGALVLISSFTTMRDVVPDFGRAIGFDRFSDEKFQRVIDRAGEAAGFDPDESNLLTHIERLDLPVLIVHGEEDELIPIRHALRLYDSASRENVELIRVAGANHTTLGDGIVEPLRRPMLGWFGRYLLEDGGNHRPGMHRSEF